MANTKKHGDIMSSNIRYRITRIVTILSLIICLWITSPFPANASLLGDFFGFTFDKIVFSKNEVNGSEIISLTIVGRATCKKNLPVSPSEGTITGSVVARNASTGKEAILNPAYTIVINPFPSKEGSFAETEQVVPLQFPTQTESGEYDIIAKLTVAKVKIVGIWLDVTEFLPQEQPIGKLKYTSSEPSSTTEPVSPFGETGITPALESPVSESPFTQSTAEQPTDNALPWWVLLLVPLVLLVIIVISIIWFVKRRRSKKAVENNI